MKRILFVFLTLPMFFLLSSCDTPISKYETKNEDEKQIIALLENYLDARNSGDMSRLQSTFHEDGVYLSNDGIEVPRSKITEMDPEWWVQGGKLKLLNPEIKLNGSEAEVLVKTKHGTHYQITNYYTLTKVDNQWFIMGHR